MKVFKEQKVEGDKCQEMSTKGGFANTSGLGEGCGLCYMVGTGEQDRSVASKPKPL